jgi:nucleoid DNA-binding protein
MKVTEIIQKMQQNNPELLKDIPEERAKALVQKIFGHMKAAVARAEEGSVQFPGFGVFRIRKVEKEIDGKKVVKKQVRFRPAGELNRMANKRKKGAASG